MDFLSLKRMHETDPLESPDGQTPKRRKLASAMSPGSKMSESIIQKTSPFGAVGSDFTSEQIAANLKNELKRLHRRKELRFDDSGNSDGTQTSSTDPELIAPDQPIFTYRQVQLICERMVYERENQIRQEYDRILNIKLSEQHDSFVTFTFEKMRENAKSFSPIYIS